MICFQEEERLQLSPILRMLEGGCSVCAGLTTVLSPNMVGLLAECGGVVKLLVSSSSDMHGYEAIIAAEMR